ncbi:hypothetical protein Vretimale_17519 [Volvox reticuliferus]|uniref:HTH myb-type domain-containing protein n=1 Tax=Volvox reticuliferus TaxID=1737510 RepID=A0A8J4GT57_9CHLO|nr:hypothetical protein Vretifemale_18199 [Volvox reticuliferus]GIM14585.1 hypothetical protein Vretimale_17519 [Volvox reticuliferus]
MQCDSSPWQDDEQAPAPRSAAPGLGTAAAGAGPSLLNSLELEAISQLQVQQQQQQAMLLLHLLQAQAQRQDGEDAATAAARAIIALLGPSLAMAAALRLSLPPALQLQLQQQQQQEQLGQHGQQPVGVIRECQLTGQRQVPPAGADAGGGATGTIAPSLLLSTAEADAAAAQVAGDRAGASGREVQTRGTADPPFNDGRRRGGGGGGGGGPRYPTSLAGAPDDGGSSPGRCWAPPESSDQDPAAERDFGRTSTAGSGAARFREVRRDERAPPAGPQPMLAQQQSGGTGKRQRQPSSPEPPRRLQLSSQQQPPGAPPPGEQLPGPPRSPRQPPRPLMQRQLPGPPPPPQRVPPSESGGDGSNSRDLSGDPHPQDQAQPQSKVNTLPGGGSGRGSGSIALPAAAAATVATPAWQATVGAVQAQAGNSALMSTGLQVLTSLMSPLGLSPALWAALAPAAAASAHPQQQQQQPLSQPLLADLLLPRAVSHIRDEALQQVETPSWLQPQQQQQAVLGPHFNRHHPDRGSDQRAHSRHLDPDPDQHDHSSEASGSGSGGRRNSRSVASGSGSGSAVMPRKCPGSGSGGGGSDAGRNAGGGDQGLNSSGNLVIVGRLDGSGGSQPSAPQRARLAEGSQCGGTIAALTPRSGAGGMDDGGGSGALPTHGSLLRPRPRQPCVAEGWMPRLACLGLQPPQEQRRDEHDGRLVCGDVAAGAAAADADADADGDSIMRDGYELQPPQIKVEEDDAAMKSALEFELTAPRQGQSPNRGELEGVTGNESQLLNAEEKNIPSRVLPLLAAASATAAEVPPPNSTRLSLVRLQRSTAECQPPHQAPPPQSQSALVAAVAPDIDGGRKQLPHCTTETQAPAQVVMAGVTGEAAADGGEGDGLDGDGGDGGGSSSGRGMPGFPEGARGGGEGGGEAGEAAPELPPPSLRGNAPPQHYAGAGCVGGQKRGLAEMAWRQSSGQFSPSRGGGCGGGAGSTDCREGGPKHRHLCSLGLKQQQPSAGNAGLWDGGAAAAATASPLPPPSPRNGPVAPPLPRPLSPATRHLPSAPVQYTHPPPHPYSQHQQQQHRLRQNLLPQQNSSSPREPTRDLYRPHHHAPRQRYNPIRSHSHTRYRLGEVKMKEGQAEAEHTGVSGAQDAAAAGPVRSPPFGAAQIRGSHFHVMRSAFAIAAAAEACSPEELMQEQECSRSSHCGDTDGGDGEGAGSGGGGSGGGSAGLDASGGDGDAEGGGSGGDGDGCGGGSGSGSGSGGNGSGASRVTAGVAASGISGGGGGGGPQQLLAASGKMKSSIADAVAAATLSFMVRPLSAASPGARSTARLNCTAGSGGGSCGGGLGPSGRNPGVFLTAALPPETAEADRGNATTTGTATATAVQLPNEHLRGRRATEGGIEGEREGVGPALVGASVGYMNQVAGGGDGVGASAAKVQLKQYHELQPTESGVLGPSFLAAAMAAAGAEGNPPIRSGAVAINVECNGGGGGGTAGASGWPHHENANTALAAAGSTGTGSGIAGGGAGGGGTAATGSGADGGGSGGGGGNGAARIVRRPRMLWTHELHSRFMAVVAQLGVETAVPKSILQLMSIDGMTRENVASHLQKYRLYLRRLAGVPPNSPIPPHLIDRVQLQAMRAHMLKHQQQMHQVIHAMRPELSGGGGGGGGGSSGTETGSAAASLALAPVLTSHPPTSNPAPPQLQQQAGAGMAAAAAAAGLNLGLLGGVQQLGLGLGLTAQLQLQLQLAALQGGGGGGGAAPGGSSSAPVMADLSGGNATFDAFAGNLAVQQQSPMPPPLPQQQQQQQQIQQQAVPRILINGGAAAASPAGPLGLVAGHDGGGGATASVLFAGAAGTGTAVGAPDDSLGGAGNVLAGGGNNTCLSAAAGVIALSTPQQEHHQPQPQPAPLSPSWQQQLQQWQAQQQLAALAALAQGQQQQQQQQEQQQQLRQQQQQLLLQLQLQQQQQQWQQLQQWQAQQQVAQGFVALQQQQQFLGAQPTSLLIPQLPSDPDLPERSSLMPPSAQLQQRFLSSAGLQPPQPLPSQPPRPEQQQQRLSAAGTPGGPGGATMATTAQQSDPDVLGAQAIAGTTGIPYRTYGCGLPALGLFGAPAPPSAGLLACSGGVGLGPFGSRFGLLGSCGGDESGAGGQSAALMPYGSAGGADPTTAMQQLYVVQQQQLQLHQLQQMQQMQQMHQAQANYLLQQQLQQQVQGSGVVCGGTLVSPFGPYAQGHLQGISAPATSGLCFPITAFSAATATAATAGPPPQQQQHQHEDLQLQPQAAALDSASWGPGETQSILPLTTANGSCSGGGGAIGMSGMPYAYGQHGAASPWALTAQPPPMQLSPLKLPHQAIDDAGAVNLAFRPDLSPPTLQLQQQQQLQPPRERERGRGEVAAADTAQQAGALLVQDPRSQGCLGGGRISGGGGGGSVADGAVSELPMPLQAGLFCLGEIRGLCVTAGCSLDRQELGGAATGVVHSSCVSDCGDAIVGGSQPPESLSSGFILSEIQLSQMSRLLNQQPQ